MSNYWMLEVREPRGGRRATIGRQPDLRALSSAPFINWLGGARFDFTPPQPLEFALDPQSGGDLTDFFPPAIPLMSGRMLDGLAAAGVDNIDRYAARLLDRDGRPVPEPFFAINIIGRLACADLEASDCTVDDPDDPVGVDFESLVIDEARAGGARFFRLREAANGIVVHEQVRAALAPLQLRGIVFVKPQDWIG